ncbi:hypothetical protein CH249_06970 [Rhodococcus sp. 05-2255-3B1]|nr:hypothetical protein CH250_11025 [Rhodococcus sp. 05-2255-3C]OZE14165.1 hypothetical protein CH249_06970 [Rhodococcus sp. 05-2255-3B1]OZE24736.1 hypothetical protein CH255_00845 [Rhodococcus sp. 05-2255-2A2]
MFAELNDLGVTHVIVHKLDRLSRSPKADYYVDSGLEATRAALVSVSEYIDDTPQGKLNLQIQRGMANYYSNNLATEVIKGLKSKLAAGGTPGRAPIGYLNKRRLEGSADIRWVELDPERANHVSWAFTEYAKGEYSLANLADALEDRGLRTRATPKVPSRPVSISSLDRLLINPYYVGIVAYKGVYHQGTHEALVDMGTGYKSRTSCMPTTPLVKRTGHVIRTFAGKFGAATAGREWSTRRIAARAETCTGTSSAWDQRTKRIDARADSSNCLQDSRLSSTRPRARLPTPLPQRPETKPSSNVSAPNYSKRTAPGQYHSTCSRVRWIGSREP